MIITKVQFHEVEEESQEKADKFSTTLCRVYIVNKFGDNLSKRNKRAIELMEESGEFKDYDLKFASSEGAIVLSVGLHEKSKED
jgi:hypothetical protein